MQAPAVPTGSVVFLFSDVEGSTRRWERYGDVMREALRRHDGILRMAIEGHRGYVFKTMGDAFCASFWTASDALAAAIEAQSALDAADFSAVGGLAVRMALHGAEIEQTGGDYFGPPLNRTARLLSAGNGGQILLSEAVAQRCAGHLPAGIRLQRMGELPLRDVTEVQDVFEAVGDCITGSGKPLRALITPRNNLPAQTTGFVGRQQDVAQLEALLDSARLVTIVGAGGIGKTRLAIEAASARLNEYPDGAWFVDLAAIAQPALVAGAVLSALGAEPSPQRSPLEALVEYLSARDVLLVLDNCEHVVSGVAELASTLLNRCRAVVLLTTSREALDVGGECIHHLAPLDAAASIRLFNQRAGSVDARFDAEQHAEAVADICARLDGMALAIELAAARLRSMPIDALARRLSLALLAGGRDKRPRQQTMQALIAWSYDLLDAPDRWTAQSCAVFAGGFTAEQASAVAAVDADGAVDALSSLVDKSLLLLDRAADEARYRFLEPIREFLWARLRESGGADAARNRHATVFARVADSASAEFERGVREDWLARNRPELPNLRVALQWTLVDGGDRGVGARLAAGTLPIFLRSSLLAEGIDWCENALRATSRPDAALQARLHYGLSMLYTNVGMPKLVLPHAASAVELYRGSGDLAGLTRALSQVAHRYARLADYEAARAAASESLELARRVGDHYLLAATLLRCASAFAAEGDEAVRERYAESVELFSALKRDPDTARALTWWAQTEAERGYYAEAALRLSEARGLAGDDLGVHLTTQLAGCYLAVGDVESARAPASESLSLAWETHHPICLPFAVLYCAATVAEREPAESARLAGYVRSALRELQWEPVPPDDIVIANLWTRVERALKPAELAELEAQGARWSQREAVERAAAAVGAPALVG